jgi:hypothetical protein
MSQSVNAPSHASGANEMHNLVLIRGQEPPRSAGARWLTIASLCIAAAAGGGIWFYLAQQPRTAVVNHAVATAPATAMAASGAPNVGSN